MSEGDVHKEIQRITEVIIKEQLIICRGYTRPPGLMNRILLHCTAASDCTLSSKSCVQVSCLIANAVFEKWKATLTEGVNGRARAEEE
jgi:hypothetical protein